MSGSHVILAVAPSGLEIGVCRGRSVIATQRHRFDRSDWPTDDAGTLDEMRSTLIESIAKLDAAGLPTTIVYFRAGGFININSCPLAAGRASSLQAARLALSSLATFPLASNPSDVRILHTDISSKTVSDKPSIHTIAAAELDEQIAVLSTWASEAGLQVTGVVPAEAVWTIAAAERVITRETPSAMLCVGEHQSVLTVGGRGRLDLVRTIAAGTETLVESLLRPIRPADGGEPITLTREAARRLLNTTGIPGLRDPLPDARGCDGSSVLPLLQPALQRMAVEIKQSLRFGVDESSRAGIALSLSGPGAAIANLGSVIARQAGLECAPVDMARGAETLVQLAAANAEHLPTLLSGDSNNRVMVRGLRRGLLAGLAAAAALLTVEGIGVHMALSQERTRLSAIDSSTAGNEALDALQEAAMHQNRLAVSLSRRVGHALGDGPAWSAVLDLLAARTPHSMRILDVSIECTTGSPVCNLRGYVRLDQTEDAAGEIRRFVDSLAGEPLVESVRLGVTQRAEIRGRDTQTFELTIGLIAVPSMEFRQTATAPMAQGAVP